MQSSVEDRAVTLMKASHQPRVRELWVDILKGILIIFVVIGHSWFPYSKYIYWFHMPVFFMISGYVFTPTKMNKEFFVALVERYMIPCYSWNVICSLLLGSLSFGRLLFMLWGGESLAVFIGI